MQQSGNFAEFSRDFTSGFKTTHSVILRQEEVSEDVLITVQKRQNSPKIKQPPGDNNYHCDDILQDPKFLDKNGQNLNEGGNFLGINQTNQYNNEQMKQLTKKLQQSMMASKMMRGGLNEENKLNKGGQEQEQEYQEKIFNFNGIEASMIMLNNPVEKNKINDQIVEQEGDNEEIMQQSMVLMKSLFRQNQRVDEQKIQVIQKQGLLQKKSKKYFVNFQTKHCVLQDKILKCYKEKNLSRAYCILDFETFHFKIQSRIIDGFTKEFCVNAIGSDVLFLFKGQNDQETFQWFDMLSKVKQNKPFLPIYDRFWKNHRISQEQFCSLASDGDLILFKGKSMNCVLQRLLTGSDYDHVGIVLSQQNKQFIMEATGSDGVGIFAWETLIKYNWSQFYDKVVFRKLTYQKDNTFIKQLQKFVTDNLGKQYKLSVSKILQNESVIMEQSKAINNNRTYFCSELVAAAYKAICVLPKTKSSTQYWPGSFSNEKVDLVLLNGAQLSDEYLIGFDK